MTHHHQTLRERLIVRYGNQQEERNQLTIPPTGRIDSDAVAEVQKVATLAWQGDDAARDHLYFTLRLRLNRASWLLRPWPNSARMVGIWDRDDVRQETWVVFAELLAAWDGQVTFVPYLLARFPWRLRDRILRGIGKRQSQYGEIRVPEEMLATELVADDCDQPESAAIARKLLEFLIQQTMMGASTPGELEAGLQLINSRDTGALISPDHILDDGERGMRTRVA